MALEFGICQLCMSSCQLARSHAIPDALIKDIHRRNNGQARFITGRSPFSRRSNDSGADHLLCETCERELNGSFDAYGVLWINQARRQLDETPRHDRKAVDPQRMLGFVSSVLWRASISRNPIYDSIVTDYGERMQLRRILETPDDRYALATMSISNLIDSEQLFSPIALRDVVIPPTSWGAISAGQKLRSFFFIVNGLLFNLTIPPPSRGTGKSVFWSADTIRPRIRDQNIRTFPPMLWMLGLPIKRKSS